MSYSREVKDSDVDPAFKRAANYLIDDLVNLKFVYQLPLEEIRIQHPSAQIILRVRMSVPNSITEQAVNILVNDKKIRSAVVTPCTDSSTSYDTPLRFMSKYQAYISFKLENNQGELYVESVELLISHEEENKYATRATSAASILTKHTLIKTISDKESAQQKSDEQSHGMLPLFSKVIKQKIPKPKHRLAKLQS